MSAKYTLREIKLMQMPSFALQTIIQLEQEADRYREALAHLHDVAAWINENEPTDFTREVETITNKVLK